MKSGILSFNKGLFFQHIRSVLWISVFFLLSQVLLQPLNLIVLLQREDTLAAVTDMQEGNILFSTAYVLQYVTYLIFPVLAGIVLTSYMTKKGSSDFMHSLPFRKPVLLTHVYAAGFTALLLPILVNAGILLVMRPFIDPIEYTAGNIAEWAGVSLFVVSFLFIVTVLVGLLVGPALLQGAMAYGVLVLPAALVIATLENAKHFILGLAAKPYMDSVLEEGVFFVRAAQYEASPFSSGEWLAYSAIALLAVVASYVLYKLRPSESFDETIVFPLLRWAFVFVFTFVAMLIGGLYFAALFSSKAWIIAGFVTGALAGYTLLQMIVQKSLRLTWPWKGFAVYTGLVGVLLIPAAVIASSYEEAVPDQDKIESVYFGEMDQPFSGVFYDPELKKLQKPEAGFMRGETAIEQVRAVHKQLIQLGEANEQTVNGYTVTIVYRLEGGSRVQRQYSVDMEALMQATSELRENPAFVRATHPLFALKETAKINYATVYNAAMGEQAGSLAETEAVEKLRAAIEKDALAGKASLFEGRFLSAVGSVDFTIGDPVTTAIYNDVQLSDEQTIRAIRELVPGAESFASAAQVERAFVVELGRESDRQELMDFLQPYEGNEPGNWEAMPFYTEEITGQEKLAALMEPSNLAEDSLRLLVIKWKGSQPNFPVLSVTGLKK